MEEGEVQPTVDADEVGGSPPAPARPASDKLTQQETILLYGLMGGWCTKCKVRVVRESETSGKAYNLGKRAHMVGRSETGPRGDADTSARERGHLRNHLLLCGTCHDEIDRDVEGWPLERLQQLRDEHLAWVARRGEQAEVDHRRIVYANSVDAACELVWIDEWPTWTQYMLHPYLSWRPAQMEKVSEFFRRIQTADWPGELPDLEVALRRLAYLLGEATTTFSARAELRDAGDLHVFRTYKQGWNPSYHRDAEAFTEWLEYYEGLIFEATKAASWVRAAWRDAGNPDFMNGERVHLVTGPHEDLREHINILEYIEEEKRQLIEAGPENVASVPTMRLDFSERPPGLERLLRDTLLDELGRDPAPDVLEGLASRLRSLDGVTDTASLFHGLPGRAPRSEQMKRITHALLQEGVLRRNPHGRGFVRGDLPD